MRRERRILSGLLAAAMLTVTGASALPVLAAGDDSMTAESYYADVDGSAWYAEAVAYCTENGLMNGVSGGNFQPDGTMTRSMLAAVLYRIAGSPESAAENPFSDVDPDSWYGSAVIWAAGQGLVDGYGNGKFGPSDQVTREQLAVFLWKYEGRPEGGGDADFLDGEQVSGWAVQAVNWAWGRELLNIRWEGRFDPDEYALRCELAWALMNYAKSRDLYPDADPDPEPEQTPAVDIWEEFRQVFGYQPAAGQVRGNGYLSGGFRLTDYSWLPASQGVKFMTYAYAPYTVGVDVSSHQREIDWQQVAASGVQFAIIRVGYRGYTKGTMNTDTYFKKNIEGALAAGLQVGVYFFSQATTIAEAVEEAQYTLKLIQGYRITYPVVFDWERQDYDTSRTQNTSEETVTACAAAFCETVKAAGYRPMVYASPSKANKLELGYLAGYPFWLAHYTKEQIPSSYTNHYDMWQYSSKWSVPGIDGNVDVNICLNPNWVY